LDKGGWGGLDLSYQGFHHSFQVLVDVRVQKSDEANTERLNERLTFFVALRRTVGEVAVAIQFDSQSQPRAVEIEDVGADAVLAPKFVAEQLATF
jgi:hypothetical protein